MRFTKCGREYVGRIEHTYPNGTVRVYFRTDTGRWSCAVVDPTTGQAL